MKKITRLMALVLVVASIAACGASPRSGRKSAEAAKEDALGANFNSATTDLYRFTWGVLDGATVAVSTDILKQNTNGGIDFDILQLAYEGNPITTLSFLEVGIAVDKTTKMCGMYVGTELYQYGDKDNRAFITTNTAMTNIDATGIRCEVSDTFSTLQIQIYPAGNSAKVTIMDPSAGMFMFNQNFVVNQ